MNIFQPLCPSVNYWSFFRLKLPSVLSDYKNHSSKRFCMVETLIEIVITIFTSMWNAHGIYNKLLCVQGHHPCGLCMIHSFRNVNASFEETEAWNVFRQWVAKKTVNDSLVLWSWSQGKIIYGTYFISTNPFPFIYVLFSEALRYFRKDS